MALLISAPLMRRAAASNAFVGETRSCGRGTGLRPCPAPGIIESLGPVRAFSLVASAGGDGGQ
jgi:hypothetical protein